jgi:hypothetical protein
MSSKARLSRILALSVIGFLSATSARATVQKADHDAETIVASVSPEMLPRANLPEISMQSTGSNGFVSDFISKSDLMLNVRLNGQSLGQPLGVTHNVFNRTPWPIYFYHSADAIYHFDRSKQVGLEVSATQDLVNGVRSDPQFDPVTREFTIYDPQLWYKQNSLLESDALRLDGQVSIFPGVTEYSRNAQGMLFSTALDATLNLKLRDYRWTAYFMGRVRPSFYNQTQPTKMFDSHERLFLSAGHFVGYHISNSFELTNSSLLDCNYSADTSGPFIRGDANDDRTQVQLNYYTPHGFARLGAYVQGLIVDPRLATTVVGLDLTFNLISAK